MPQDFENNLPIYIQLVEQIKLSIISGELRLGMRLPSVREWALETKVNPNTMQKALVELEEIGLVYTERTSGRFVTQNQDLVLQYKQEYANKFSEEYLKNMQKLGFDKTEAINLLYGGNK